jgi:ATP-dependent Clp protease ATP-binding subunit ClpA
MHQLTWRQENNNVFERFTEKAIKVIMLAQEEARRLGHNFVGTEQILLGLIGEGTGIAAKKLRASGVNLKDARVKVERIISRGSGFVSVEIPFTPRAKRLLELSWDEARTLGHNYIGTEHLLLGLMREGEGVGARVLEEFGIDFAQLRLSLIGELPVSNVTVELHRITKTSLERNLENIVQLLRNAKSLATNEVKDELVKMLERHEEELSSELSAIASSRQQANPSSFPEKYGKVFLLAQEEATRLGRNSIGTEQLLLGLIGEHRGVAAKALSLAGVKLEDARVEVEKITGQGSAVVMVESPYTARAKRVIELSIEQSKNLGHEHVGTGHLLLGLIEEGGGVGVKVLENLGVDLKLLSSSVLELIKEKDKRDNK